MARYIYIGLLIPFFVLISSCGPSEVDIVRTYLLPSGNPDTVRGSFMLDNYKNEGALVILQKIYQAKDKKYLSTTFFIEFERVFFDADLKKQDIYFDYLLRKHRCRNYLDDTLLTWEQQKDSVAYWVAFSMHSYYLGLAQNDDPTLNKLVSKGLYENLAEGKIPPILTHRTPARSSARQILLIIILVLLTVASFIAINARQNRQLQRQQTDDRVTPSHPQPSDVPEPEHAIIFKPVEKPIKIETTTQIISNNSIKKQLKSEKSATDQPHSSPLDAKMISPPNLGFEQKETDQEYISKNAALPHGSYFSKFGQFASGELYVELRINTEKPHEAEIHLPADPYSLQYLFEVANELGKVCEWHGGDIKQPYQEVKYDSGHAKQDKHGWFIDKKIKIHD